MNNENLNSVPEPKTNDEPDAIRFAATERPVTRREAMMGLASLGLYGVTLSIAGCGGGGVTGTSSSSHSSSSSSSSFTAEGEIGPYFTDDSASGYNRSNILSSLDGSDTQAGIPLTLNLIVLDSENGFAAYKGAQVDIWHCNASGVYSNESSESTSGQSWLRGYQITDANGKASFTTIIPGWYAGRTTHIHLRVRSKYSTASSTSDETNTTQVFFAQTMVDTIDTTISPYSAEGKNSTTNASDRVYATQTKGQNLLTISGNNTSGYTAAFTIYLPITTEY
ncbi:MAG TPA: hypothetical protein VGL56_06485 [Fimbriimonadaceae bacterium]|jgi:protocatechuate 3,4-dioxygenase beta subunit